MTINPRTQEAYQLFHEGTLALCRAEQQGIRVDVDYIKNKKEQLTRKIDRLETTFQDSKFYRHWEHSKKGKVNIYSNQQLAHFLYNIKKIPAPKETISGQGATDEDALKSLNIEELDNLLQIRKLKKVKDTYLDAFLREQVNDYIHPFFNLHLVRTFRSSSDSPNFQNIPKRDEEAMRIVRKALYPRPGHQLLEVDFSGLEVRIAACVVASTKIETIDGKQSIKRIIKRLEQGEEVYVYGYNEEKQRIGVAKVTEGGLTKEQAEVWQITLDNDQIIKATPDHKFMLRDGTYVPLKDLKPNDSLMPFYTKNKISKWKTVYQEIYLNNGKKILAHNLIAEDVRGVKIAGSSKLVHHKNGNGCDNSLINTEIMSRKRHMKIHSVQGWLNKPKSERQSWMKTPEGRAFARNMNKKRNEEWSQQEWMVFGQKISDSIARRGGYYGKNNPMYGKYHSEISKEKNRQKHLGENNSNYGKKAWNNGLTKETNESIAKISRKNRGRIPYNKGMVGLYKASEETKRLISLKGLGREVSQETKEKLSKNKIKNWKERKDQGKNKECKICHSKFFTLTNSHLRDKHNLTVFEYNQTYNHKVKSIKFCGYEDVYNINVEGVHNYALSAGVVVKNCYHKDSTMLKYIKDPTTDMHRDMAIQIFKLDDFVKGTHDVLRQAAKNGFVFPEFYGDYYVNCASNMACGWLKLPNGTWSAGQGIQINDTYTSDHMISKGLTSLDKFEKHVKTIEDDFWFNRFKEYAEWKERWYKVYKKYGYIDLLTGFRCSGVMRKNEVINTPVQGAAFHCLLWSFVEMDRLLIEQKLDTKLIGQIHDSMILDVNPAELDTIVSLVRRVTCIDLPKAWTWINVPLDVEIEMCAVDDSWAEKTKMKFNK